MLKAKKNPVATKMFQLVQERLLKGTFGKLYVKNDYNAADAALYIANHSSWWDAFIV